MDKRPKIYASFEEIELDLQILKLQREIHAQKIKRGIQRTKENLKPVNLLEDYIGESNKSTFSMVEQLVKIILHFALKPFKSE
jgi:hypothetical protein